MKPTGVDALDLTKYKSVHPKLLVLIVFSIAVYVCVYNSITYHTRPFAETNNDINTMRNEEKLYIAKYLARQFRMKRDTSNLYFEDWERFLSRFGQIPTSDVNTGAYGYTLLVLFTTFDDDASKYICRNNTLNNWKSFGALVKPVFFTADDNLAKRVKEKGWDVLSPFKTRIGIPVLKYMFLDVMKQYPAKFYAYANGDILFVDNLIDTLLFILNLDFDQTYPMLIVGRRTNVEYVTEEQASSHENILKAAKRGALYMSDAEDYFISNPNYPWLDIPEVVVGRIAYDNWLILNAIELNHITIDASNTILAIHQTTESGNLEGHSHTDRNFNANLLRILHRKTNFEGGKTNCIPMYTTYNITNNYMQLYSRKGC